MLDEAIWVVSLLEKNLSKKMVKRNRYIVYLIRIYFWLTLTLTVVYLVPMVSFVASRHLSILGVGLKFVTNTSA